MDGKKREGGWGRGRARAVLYPCYGGERTGGGGGENGRVGRCAVVFGAVVARLKRGTEGETGVVSFGAAVARMEKVDGG